MRKIASLVLVLALAAALCVPAAANTTRVVFVYEENTPSWTITVPAVIELSQSGTAAEIIAEDVENIPDGQRISVTVADTSDPNGFGYFTLQTRPYNGSWQRYNIQLENGDIVGPVGTMDNPGNIGQELCAFTEDGTANLIFTAITHHPGAYNTYYGNITYGIALI